MGVGVKKTSTFSLVSNRPCVLHWDEFILDGVDDDLGAAFDVEFFKGFADMDFYGFVADEEAVGNFFVAHPFH